MSPQHTHIGRCGDIWGRPVSSSGLHSAEMMNTAESRFSLMTADIKSQWKCPACRCKQPKAYSINTPVRQLMESAVGEVADNMKMPLDGITTRKKRQPTGMQLNNGEEEEMDERELVDINKSNWIGLTEESIKNIIRQEVTVIVERSIQSMVVGIFNNLEQEIKNLLALRVRYIPNKDKNQ